jgi:ankyrin repeat protein
MVHNISLACALACLVLALSAENSYGQLPPPRSYLFVDVKDTSGQPVTDASIALYGADGKRISSRVANEGKISVTFPIRSDPHYSVLVSREGFQPSEHVFFPRPSGHGTTLFEKMPIGFTIQSSPIVLHKCPATESERKAVDAQELQNQIILAAKRGDSLRVSKLLQLGVDADTVDNDGVSALLWAAFTGDADTINALLERGAHVRTKNPLGSKVLLIYLAEGLVREQKGRTSRGDDTRDLSKPEGIVSNLIKGGADVNTRDEGRLSTPLMWASRSGSLEIVRMLLAAGASIDVKDKQGRTALRWAQVAQTDPGRYNSELVNTLIKSGANVNVSDEYGTTPLILAAKLDLTESVKMLLAAGAQVNAKDKLGDTALVAAFDSYYSSHTDSIHHPTPLTTSTLIKAGADIHAVNSVGIPLLMLAARTNSLEALKMLLEGGVPVNVRDKKGRTALMYELWSYMPSVEVFKVLIAAKGDLNAVDHGGRTPLMYAATAGPPELVELLLEAGAKAGVNAQDNSGQTALMYASYYSNLGTNPEDQIRRIKTLLEAGADVSIKDNSGQTALGLAVYIRNQPVIELLKSKLPH